MASQSDRRPPNDASREPTDELELQEIQTHEDDYDENEDAYAVSTASLSSGENRVAPCRSVSRTTTRSRVSERGSIGRFWTRHVVMTVPQKSNRDHYALERTFLAYIRTSVILSMQGVLVAQLFRLQRSIEQEQSELTYYEVAIPLSVACHCVALLVVVIGAFRFWRQQSAIVAGRVHAGGWELNWIGVLIALVIIATLVLSVVIAVKLDEGQ